MAPSFFQFGGNVGELGQNIGMVCNANQGGDMSIIKKYYHERFRGDLAAFMPSTEVPYFGHSWNYDCEHIETLPSEHRANFLICLYFTVLIDQAMYTYYRERYNEFNSLTKHPKFCHGLGQVQKNPREILYVPVEKGLVDKKQMEKEIPAGMELFVDEVIDFCQNQMKDISAAELLEKLRFDRDVQIPLLLILLDPKLKEDVVVQAYEAFRLVMEKKFPHARVADPVRGPVK